VKRVKDLLDSFWLHIFHKFCHFKDPFEVPLPGVVVVEHLEPQVDQGLGEFEAHLIEMGFGKLGYDRVNRWLY
jgi:hypothetical protein